MYFYGIKEAKLRMLAALQDELRRFPAFQETRIYNHHPDNIERDKTNIILTTSSMDPYQLDPDNFMMVECSRVSLGKVGNSPGAFISWAFEDCPTIPEAGLYYLQVVDVRSDNSALLYIQVLRRVSNEVVLFNYMGESSLYLDHSSVRGCSLNLFANRQRLVQGFHYTLDESTGVITWVPGQEPPYRTQITATYTYEDAPLGQFEVFSSRAYTDIIPGVLLAFAPAFGLEDIMVVIVSENREASSNVYGGRIDVTQNFDIKSMDTPSADQHIDQVVASVWGKIKLLLAEEGIILSKVGVSNESQDQEDATEQQWSYSYSFNTALQCDWEMKIPILRQIINGIVINMPDNFDPATATISEILAAEVEVLNDPTRGPVTSFPPESEPSSGSC